MLNEKKVILMTKMALLENKEQEALRINRFRRRDYLWSHILKMMLAATAVFLLVVGVCVFVHIQKAELAVSIEGIPLFLVGLLAGYLVYLVLSVVLTWKIYGKRYDRKKAVAERLSKYVAHLDRYYEKEFGNE